MKLAVQEGMLPATSIAEKACQAVEYGYDALEVSFLGFPERLPEVRAAARNSGLAISTICGSGRHDILTLDAQERQSRIAEIKRLLECAGELDAVGLIIVPIRTPQRFPDLSPFRSERELEEELTVSILSELAPYAVQCGTKLLLEPLIRYETPFIRRLDEAMAVCERVSSPGLALMADFFHMNTEEADIPAAIRDAGRWLRHVHLADSNRLLPGMGHTDFVAGFRALMDVNFEDYMSLECGILGPRNEELPRTAQYLRQVIEQARAF